MSRCLVVLFLLVGLAAHASPPPVDAQALAALLLRDGHPERALRALEAQDPQAKGVDPVRHHTLKGLAHLRLSHDSEARSELEQALAAARAREERPDPVLFIYLAQAAYRMKDYRATLGYLDRAGEVLARYPALQLVRGQSLWALGEREAAWSALAEAEQSHPDDPRFPRQRLSWLLELGLYRQAGELGRRYLARLAQGPRDYLAVADALRRAGGMEEAAVLLERARLRYPGDPTLLRLLGQVYLERGQILTAAELYRRAAYLDPRHLVEAAELYRRAGHPYQALFLNMGVLDQSAKMRQRLGLLVELGRFEEAAAMADTLRRLHLLEDDAVRYTLAYAYFKTRRLDEAETVLSGIQQADWFRKATALRVAVVRCREDRLTCL